MKAKEDAEDEGEEPHEDGAHRADHKDAAAAGGKDDTEDEDDEGLVRNSNTSRLGEGKDSLGGLDSPNLKQSSEREEDERKDAVTPPLTPSCSERL
jgi:hypothetical protein